MSTTHFIDGSTPVVADWLNDVDEAVYVTLLDKLDSSDIGVTVQAHSDTLDSVASVEFNTLSRQSSPTGSTKISAGTTAQRDASPEFGWQRANSTNTTMEWWDGSAWVSLGSGILDGSVTTPKFAADAKAPYAGQADAAPSNTQFGWRNIITNGAMQIDQRNAGSVATITGGAALQYTLDRWYVYCTGATATAQRVAGSSPNRYKLRLVGAAGMTKLAAAQRIEAENCYHLAGTTATLSADLANGLLTTVTWTVWYANTTDTFGTLASPTRTQIATGTFTVDGTMTRKSVQISIPSAATTGLEVEFSVAAQTASYFDIGRVQLVGGATDTPFEYRPLSVELHMCQRYFQWLPFNINMLAAAGGQFFETGISYPTTMRAAPTAATLVADPSTAQTASNNATNLVQRMGTTGASLSVSSTAAGYVYVIGYRSALSAEL